MWLSEQVPEDPELLNMQPLEDVIIFYLHARELIQLNK